MVFTFIFLFNFDTNQDSVESSLQTIHDIATENLGTVCLTKSFCRLKVPLNVARYEGSRQKADLVALVLQDIGFNRHGNSKYSIILNK